jgi:hypothetical protein
MVILEQVNRRSDGEMVSCILLNVRAGREMGVCRCSRRGDVSSMRIIPSQEVANAIDEAES